MYVCIQGRGWGGCNPPLSSICLVFCLILPKIIKDFFEGKLTHFHHLTACQFMKRSMQDTLDGKTHMLRCFPGNVWAPCHLSRCCYFPHEYRNLKSSTGSWNWDKDTITKAQGLKASLLSFQAVVVFITTKNILEEVKALASKLQKWDQDTFEAYMMVDEVIQNVKSARKNLDSDFQIWYKEILDLGNRWSYSQKDKHTEESLKHFHFWSNWSLQKHLWLFPFLTPSLFKCKTDFLTRTATSITCFI